jgi:hypothetical protein
MGGVFAGFHRSRSGESSVLVAHRLGRLPGGEADNKFAETGGGASQGQHVISHKIGQQAISSRPQLYIFGGVEVSFCVVSVGR